jgi:gamma-glutamyl hydrolase
MGLLSIVFGLFAVSVYCDNNNPIIGILTQPVNESPTRSYIAASYVKFIESAGARVVPIFHNAPETELKRLFSSINGILYPGGGADLQNTQMYKAGKYLYDLAIQANDNSDYFPLEGHCMGFQFLSMITSQNITLLSRQELENTSVALNFYPGYQNSKIFGNAPTQILDIFANQKVTLNNHHYGVDPGSFNANQYLPKFYKLLSWNKDVSGSTFISTMEGIDYPVYALQWHAEKPLFEWNNWEDINHSTDAISAMQYIADHLVQEARKNGHKFATAAEESAALIYNYPVTYTGPNNGDFVQTYYFNK